MTHTIDVTVEFGTSEPLRQRVGAALWVNATHFTALATGGGRREYRLQTTYRETVTTTDAVALTLAEITGALAADGAGEPDVRLIHAAETVHP